MHELPKLPYAYDALEPVIDARTMELHHGKHHATYVVKLNEALLKSSEWQGKPIEELLLNLEALSPQIRMAIRNHGGGHHNHSLFWTMMRTPRENNTPEGALLEAIIKTFGNFDAFKEEFTKNALGIFGSGWAWLVKDTVGELKIITNTNQDSPLIQHLTPILGLDVWEHAYYLNYQNRRADYIAAWWTIVNWDGATERF
jgi:Fe-Mn family superoxide dismutase